jgi:hypothetical protein
MRTAPAANALALCADSPQDAATTQPGTCPGPWPPAGLAGQPAGSVYAPETRWERDRDAHRAGRECTRAVRGLPTGCGHDPAGRDASRPLASDGTQATQPVPFTLLKPVGKGTVMRTAPAAGCRDERETQCSRCADSLTARGDGTSRPGMVRALASDGTQATQRVPFTLLKPVWKGTGMRTAPAAGWRDERETQWRSVHGLPTGAATIQPDASRSLTSNGTRRPASRFRAE